MHVGVFVCQVEAVQVTSLQLKTWTGNKFAAMMKHSVTIHMFTVSGHVQRFIIHLNYIINTS